MINIVTLPDNWNENKTVYKLRYEHEGRGQEYVLYGMVVEDFMYLHFVLNVRIEVLLHSTIFTLFDFVNAVFREECRMESVRAFLSKILCNSRLMVTRLM